MLKFTTPRPFLYVEETSSKEMDCPVCGWALRDSEDQKSYDEKKACTDCVNTFYYPNSEAWDSGWRPSREIVRKRLQPILKRKGARNA